MGGQGNMNDVGRAGCFEEQGLNGQTGEFWAAIGRGDDDHQIKSGAGDL